MVLPVPDKHSCGMLLALAIWLTIFMTRPHKEERFLFPVYPLVCFAVVYAVERLKVSWWAGEGVGHMSCTHLHSCAQGLLGYLSGRSHWRIKSLIMPIAIATILIHGLLSTSRVLALYRGEGPTP